MSQLDTAKKKPGTRKTPDPEVTSRLYAILSPEWDLKRDSRFLGGGVSSPGIFANSLWKVRGAEDPKIKSSQGIEATDSR
jgi:hypothetical protein